MNNPVTTYRQNQIAGLSQRDLIVMCYKGAIKYLEDARGRWEQGDGEGFSELIEKAHRVVFHLYTTLDMEKGGEIAQHLAELYSYVINQIYLLNATKNLALLNAVVGILARLKSGWEEIDIAAVRKSAPREDVSAPSQMVSVEV